MNLDLFLHDAQSAVTLLRETTLGSEASSRERPYEHAMSFCFVTHDSMINPCCYSSKCI